MLLRMRSEITSQPLRMRTLRVARPHGEEARSAVSNHECSAHDSAFSRHAVPEFCKIIRPKDRGRREDRVRAAPAVSRAKVEKKTHTSIQVQRKHSGLPCAMVLRLISRSPRRSAFLPPSSLRSLRLKNLMPASRHQNHTTSPSASVPFVLRHSRVHRSPRPTSVTIAIRPSCGHGMTSISR
jgi:hypothetical protein